MTAWASPTAADYLTFPVSDCTVVEPHVRIRCTVVTSVGPALTWRVVVEGQSNTLPVSSTALPVISGASFGSAASSADTRGGTLLHITGLNFGPMSQLIQVVVTLPVGEAFASNCTLVVPDTEVACVLPRGTGTLSRISVTVLTQTAVFEPVGLAYTAPTVHSIGPAAWGTDLSSLSVTLMGSGFGPSTQSSAVHLRLQGGSTCGPNVTLVASSVSVRSDGEVVFVVQAPPMAHVVAQWSVVVDVSGQSASSAVLTLAPQAPTFTFDSMPNATHFFLALSGANFGPVVARDCASDVGVAVDGSPCDGLVMMKVRA